MDHRNQPINNNITKHNKARWILHGIYWPSSWCDITTWLSHRWQVTPSFVIAISPMYSWPAIVSLHIFTPVERHSKRLTPEVTRAFIFDNLHLPKKVKTDREHASNFHQGCPFFTGLALLGDRTSTGTIASQKDMDFYNLIVSTSVYLLIAHNL